MRIAKKIFPYPIINHNEVYSTFEKATFDIIFNEEENSKNYELHDVKYDTNSDLLNSLINEGNVKVALIVECSETIVRRMYNITKEDGTTIILPKNEFNGKVEYSMFAYATKDFILKDSTEFIDDYQGFDFNIQKNSIIAANDGYTVTIEHEEKEDNIVKSIFSIIPVDDDEQVVKVDFESNTKKIIISLPENCFNIYNQIYNIDTYSSTFFSILLVPCLAEALSECKRLINTDYEFEDLEDYYKWFKSILISYKNQTGNELTVEEFSKYSTTHLAQILLGKPITNTLTSIMLSTGNDGDDDE